jgi:hypothetical protein
VFGPYSNFLTPLVFEDILKEKQSNSAISYKEGPQSNDGPQSDIILDPPLIYMNI